MIPTLRDKEYRRGLDELNLFTLKNRRLRRKLIAKFKTLESFFSGDNRNFFTLNEKHTQNNG